MALGAARFDSSLDETQNRIASEAAAERIVVTAGPGTGKTRTLIARARWLIEHEDIGAGTELLILSFSRAAVETVATRAASQADMGRLRVKTFDSFASQLLIDAGRPADQGSYDRRIRAATLAVEELSASISTLAEVRHVLIDEAQDVVGVRTDFVTALLSAVCRKQGVGFTVFGDPAQAIYDFQAADEIHPNRLLDAPELVSLGATQRELITNYRMEERRLAPLASSFGARIRMEAGDAYSLWSDIAEEVAFDSGWMDLDDAIPDIQATARSAGARSVAVLCRTNAEVLRLGSMLQVAGVNVRVQHRAEDRGGAPWLVRMFAGARFEQAPLVDPADFQSGPDWIRPPIDVDRQLKLANLASASKVDLGRLGQLLRCGACPEELTARRDSPVTVSTIHRAKGLEFDVVYVLKNTREPDDERAALEESRVLYVAATRARDELLESVPLSFDGPVRQADDSNRAVVCSWQKKKRPRYVEVRVSDSDAEWAPDTPEAHRDLQAVLTEMSPGSSVALHLVHDGEAPIYEARTGDAKEVVIGRTASAFGEALKRCVWGRTPTEITGLTSEIPDTAVLNAGRARMAGVGPHGLHLRARFYGLGHLRFDG